MRIWWKNCPSCKKNLEMGTRGDTPVGEMFVICPNCRTLIKTGRKEWAIMPKSEKLWFKLRMTFTIGFYTAGLVLLLWAAQGDHDYNPAVISLIGTGIYLFVTFDSISDFKKIIDESNKRMNDSNYLQALQQLGLITKPEPVDCDQ